MSSSLSGKQSRRERQIMEVVYRLGEASAVDVLAHLEDPPSYSAVRALLKILEAKGYLQHRRDGRRHLYLPTVPRDQAAKGALSQLVRTFFGGSAVQAAAALLDPASSKLSRNELNELRRLIDRARKEGR